MSEGLNGIDIQEFLGSLLDLDCAVLDGDEKDVYSTNNPELNVQLNYGISEQSITEHTRADNGLHQHVHYQVNESSRVTKQCDKLTITADETIRCDESVSPKSCDSLSDSDQNNKQFSITKSPPRIIRAVLPFREVRSLGLGIAKGFNEGNMNLLVGIVIDYGRPDVAYRQMRVENNVPRLAIQHGPKPVIDFFNALVNSYPDGSIAVKSITNGIEQGLQVVRTKMAFKGTRVVDPSISPVPLKVTVKIKAKCYLDSSNRVTVFDTFLLVKTSIPQ